MDGWSPAVEGILSPTIWQQERSILCRAVFQPSLLFEAMMFTCQHGPRPMISPRGFKRNPPPFSLSRLSLTSVADIPGYPTRYALFGGPQTRTKAVIAAQMLPWAAHSMLRGLFAKAPSIFIFVLTSDRGFARKILLRRKLRAACRDVDPQDTRECLDQVKPGAKDEWKRLSVFA